MVRRIVIGLVALAVLTPIWWTDAEAGCIQWRTIGGSSCCTAWSTKGVQVDITFNQDCGEFGTNCSATVRATAQAGDAVALCQNLTTQQIVRRECTGAVSFIGFATSCDPSSKHDKDPDEGGGGHLQGKHGGGCTATVILEPDGLDACTQCGTVCQTGEACVDVTPVEMTTRVDATAGGSSDFVPTALTNSGCEGSTCTFFEQCSINPKRIGLVEPICDPETESCFFPGEPYQCNVVCSGTGCNEGG